MIRAALALLASLWLAGCGPAAEEERTTWPDPAPALWQVTAPGGETGWLFGTIHSLPNDIDWHTPPVDAALGQARLLVVEIANLEDSDAAVRAFAARATTYGLPDLTQRVTAPDRAALAALMDRASADNGDFRHIESWAAALMLANTTGTGDSSNGVDRALLRGDLPTLGLESFEEQFDRFDRLSETEQAALLRQVAQEAARPTEQLLVRAWLEGDLVEIERLADTGLLSEPGLHQALLVDRNRSWIGRVDGLIAGGRRPFVAVGTAHLVGEHGLPTLLQARGYAVTRLQ